MSNGPRKLILINAGKYDYAEVDLEGALQIVGPNNTGKTTLINTLQFLYLNDQREMDFGAYTKEQTRDFYFRSQYSYVLFECLSSRGSCVFGWRGTSRTAGGDPERFLYFGPFEAANFFDDKGAVREPRDINARLALKQYETIKTQQQHRELLLNATAGNDSGLGIISLRDADKYPHFRETLKNLLSLSTITQEQMKERLLMMADIRPEEVALDARQMFGDDYDRIRSQRESLIRFKSRVDAIRALVANHAELQELRSEAVYRWTDLRRQREQFELEHKCTVDSLRSDVATAEEKARLADEELLDRRKDEAAHHEAKGGWDAQLRALKKEKEGFRDFVEELERVAVRELERETHCLHQSILEGEAETREKAEQKVQLFSEQVRDRENTLRNADRLIVTALRKRFKDQDLDRAFSILNFNLLELPMGADGVEVLSESELSRRLGEVLQGAGPEGYSDAAVKLRYPASRRSVTDLGDPKVIGEQLLEYQSSLNRWRGILQSIQQREKLQAELQSKRDLLEAKRRELIRWEEYSKRKADEPRLLAELEKLQEALTQTASRIRLLVEASHTQSEQARKSREAIRDAENSFNAVM
ncbi:MAG: hypothetical protein FJ405_18610, partial [Verrucomicrobia bacterium]|nr:hypothetical protein [Verrucomicrobiota bacterium]